MSAPFSAVVAGHICLDIIPDLSHVPDGSLASLLQPGSLLEVGPALLSTGGPVSNTGLALHRLGVPVQLAGKIGADPLGRVVLELIERQGPDLSAGMIVDPGVNTSYTVILNLPGTDRCFLHDPAANHTFCAADLDVERIAGAGLFHFGYPPLMRRMYQHGGAELAALLARAQAAGITTSLDMTYPDPASEAGQVDWNTLLANVLPSVNIFLPSIEEILFMLDRPLHDRLKARGSIVAQASVDLLHRLSAQLLDMGAQVVGIKTGERGFYLRTATDIEQVGSACPRQSAAWQGRELWAPCFKVQVVGTTGSGDATIAGFLASLLRSLSPEAAVTAAVAVGACNVEAADALSGLRSWEDTLARIASGWARLPLEVDAPGWECDHEYGLWART